MNAVIVLLGILSVTALGRYQDLSESAVDATVDATYSIVSSYLLLLNGGCYVIAGSPDNATFVTIDGVSMRFFNARVRNTQTNAHVPPGTPNRNNQETRAWYMMFSIPPPVIGRNANNSIGWAMYTGNGGCGLGSSRC